jgi:hypothetical protein
VNRSRRSLLLTVGGLSIVSLAFAQTRTLLPGGGSIVVPSPYRSKTDYPNYADRVPNALIAYRNWDSTLSGHPDCDGMLAVGLAARFESFERFVQQSGGALSIRWSDATKIPGQPWDGKEKHYPMERAEGSEGPERTRQMAVQRSGWFSTYDEPAHLYAIAHRRGVHIAVWLYDKHGGVRGARKLADQIASSFQA